MPNTSSKMKLFLFVVVLLHASGFITGASQYSDASIQFSLSFFRTAYNLNPTNNCILSPIAIQHSLALLHHATKRNKTKHLQGTLRLQDRHYSFADGYAPFLNDLGNHALEMITKVFHPQIELNPNLLPVLQAEYSVDVQVADFSRPEQVVNSVNSWASRFTNGLVGDVFYGGGYSRDANLMIINTLTLNASWEYPLLSVHKDEFRFRNGAKEVDMMQINKGLRSCEIGDLRIVELAYERTSDLSMLFIKSDSQPLEKVVERLDLQMYRTIDEQLYEDRAKLTIPKFTISMGIGARRVLKAMGLGYVFRNDAFDVFLGFSSRLADVYQALKIDIDGSGAHAAAGTYSDHHVRFGLESRYDGPFVFVIRKNSTKDIVFIGHYSSDV
nr:leukocyte elastase inhibitor-like [Aedes albopictus]